MKKLLLPLIMNGLKKKTAIKLAKVYNASIVNNVVLDADNNDVVAEIVGAIIGSILDDKDENIPFPLP
ncbi:hypothetical protein ACVZHJ_17970 [Vibrio diabolicus]